MEQQKFDEYLKTRYYDQLAWYEKKSAHYKTMYQRYQGFIIVVSALTPVVAASAWNDTAYGKTLVVVISSCVAIATSLLKVFKYYENWINYRNTNESLKREIFYYNAAAGPYKGVEDKTTFFVERVEDIFASENNNWKQSSAPQPAS